jgi:hypothetical protein
MSVSARSMRPTTAVGRSDRPVAWLAYGTTGLPLVLILVRYLFAGGHVFLSDDLALIDLHTRLALHWRQQLGAFDHFGWNHPGPVLFYLLATVSRVLGSGAKAEYVGAIIINGAAAMLVVRVVRRHAGSWVALWAAVGIGVLLFSISFTSPGDVTFSEGAAGAIVSPWNPLVVIVPTLLVAVLCAAGVCGSPLSLLGATLVGSFCIQTDIGTAPVVVVLLVISAAVLGAQSLRRRRGHGPMGQPDVTPGTATIGDTTPTSERSRRVHRRALLIAGLIVLVVIWIPPVVQQLTNNPGNLTLIARFFFAANPTHGLTAGLWSVVSVNSVLLFGTSVVFAPAVPIAMPLAHATVVLVISVVIVSGGLALNIGARHRFGTALAAGSVVGFAVGTYSATRIAGPVWGYLMLWELGLPLLAMVSLGTAAEKALVGRNRSAPTRLDQVALLEDNDGPDHRTQRTRPLAMPLRRPLAVLTITISLLVCGALSYRMSAIPSLSAVSAREVQRSVAVVMRHLQPSAGPVLVQNAGLSFYDTFNFIGLVNELDVRGYRPKVSAFWKVQFGPSYLATGREHLTIVLQPWSIGATRKAGYLGRAGDMALRVTR